MAAGSLPTRGAWIEIAGRKSFATTSLSLPTRGAWIEIIEYRKAFMDYVSLPTRGAWIEMPTCLFKDANGKVAPHAGSVD